MKDTFRPINAVQIQRVPRAALHMMQPINAILFRLVVTA